MRSMSLLAGVLLVAIVSLSGLLLSSTMAQEATPAACPETTPEENAQHIIAYHDAVAASEDVSAFLGPEHTAHLPNGRVEVNDVPGWAMEYQEDWGNLSITVEQILAQDDLVAAYFRYSAIHQDDDEMRGYPETGREAEWVESVIYRLECGKIVELWPVVDSLGRLRDLGIVTEEELQTAEGLATPTP
jgi:predicted ester cyclase